MAKARELYKIEDIHPVDEWHNFKDHLIGKEIKVLYSHESIIEEDFQFVIGEVKESTFGEKHKTFLAIKLQKLGETC